MNERSDSAQGWMSRYWDPEEVGANASERMDVPARVRSRREKRRLASSTPDGVGQIKSGSSHLNVPDKKWDFPL